MSADDYPPEIRDVLRSRQAELDRLRAEVKLMHPVIEAARALAALWADEITVLPEGWVVHRGLFAAVAALDAGEPQP